MRNDSLNSWGHEGRALKKADIDSLSGFLQSLLPYDYQNFLLVHNGGAPKFPHVFRVQNLRKGEDVALQILLGIDLDIESSNLYWAIQTFNNRIPKGMLPIGYDGGGNVLLLSLMQQDQGAVYFWNHDEEHSPPTYRNIHKVADSFSHFLDNLQEFKPDWETPIDDAIRKDDVIRLEQYLKSYDDLEKIDQWGRTMMENAALANSQNVMKYLFAKGAKLRNSLTLVQENARIIPELSQSVELLKQMTQRQ